MQTTAQLRPMSIGDVLDAAFRLYRRHFLVFLGISALLQVPMAIVQFAAQVVLAGQAFREIMEFSRNPPRALPGQNPLELLPIPEYLLFFGVTLTISALYYLVVHNLTSAALANAVAQSQHGRPVSILGAYTLGAGRYLSLIAASLAPVLVMAVAFGLLFGCVGGVAAMAGAGLGDRLGVAGAIGLALLMLGLLLVLGLLSLFLFVRLALTTQAIVLEGRGPFGGLGRSWRLVGRGFWRTLLIVVLMGIITYLVSSVPALVASMAMGVVSGTFGTSALSQGAASFVAYAGLILALPLQLAVYTVLYYDLRVRSEGYDLELRASQL